MTQPTLKRRRVKVSITPGPSGIAHDSMIFCEEVSTLSNRFFADGPLGPRVPERILDAVVLGVRRALGEVVREP